MGWNDVLKYSESKLHEAVCLRAMDHSAEPRRACTQIYQSHPALGQTLNLFLEVLPRGIFVIDCVVCYLLTKVCGEVWAGWRDRGQRIFSKKVQRRDQTRAQKPGSRNRGKISPIRECSGAGPWRFAVRAQLLPDPAQLPRNHLETVSRSPCSSSPCA